jgi:hypothetical protein
MDAPSTPGGLRAQAEQEDIGKSRMMQPASPMIAEKRLAMPAPSATPQETSNFELPRSVISAAQATELGELFEYAITTPVSLNRQKSAMLPIVNTAVTGDKVSIYNANVHAKHPLSGLRLKNTTELYLMQGPVTVYEENTYAGDARLSDVAPGQTQLISYAIDLKTEVQTAAPAQEQELVTVRLQKGVLIATRRAMTEQRYTLRNRDQTAKTVLIEHPYQSDWNLVQPDKPTERTRDVYRFAPEVAPISTRRRLAIRLSKRFNRWWR